MSKRKGIADSSHKDDKSTSVNHRIGLIWYL